MEKCSKISTKSFTKDKLLLLRINQMHNYHRNRLGGYSKKSVNNNDANSDKAV